jgi:protein-tyrosine phosphatase
MIDLHTHILPDWDDGAKTWEDARRMCEVAKADGIETIALTPHINRLTKHGDDFDLLDKRMADFLERADGCGLNAVRGAEVFIQHDIKSVAKNRNLTINGGSYLFIEFPADSIIPGVKEFIYDLMLSGIVPIISHPERNTVFSLRPDLFYELVCMGCLGQVTAMSLTGAFGAEIKKVADLFLRHNLAHIIASDAHDAERRPPRLAAAADAAAKVVGEEKAGAMVEDIPQAILSDSGLPDWGEPENPLKQRKQWKIRLPKRSREGN